MRRLRRIVVDATIGCEDAGEGVAYVARVVGLFDGRGEAGWHVLHEQAVGRRNLELEGADSSTSVAECVQPQTNPHIPPQRFLLFGAHQPRRRGRTAVRSREGGWRREKVDRTCRAGEASTAASHGSEARPGRHGANCRLKGGEGTDERGVDLKAWLHMSAINYGSAAPKRSSSFGEVEFTTRSPDRPMAKFACVWTTPISRRSLTCSRCGSPSRRPPPSASAPGRS